MIVDVLKINNESSIDNIYKEVSRYLTKEKIISSDELFLKELIERENLGAIKVYSDLYLPHLESSNINKNIILRIDGVKDKILFVLIKEDDLKAKEKAIKIVTTLLDRDIVDNLFNVNKNNFIMEQYFNRDNIYLEVEGENFDEVLRNVSNILEDKKFVKESFYNAVLEREKVFPTGLEFPNYNIAIPHTDSVHVNTNSIVVIKPKNEIVFKDMGTNSKDLSTKVILLLLISKNEDQVAVLSGIIKKFADEQVYNNILNSNDNSEIYDLITK